MTNMRENIVRLSINMLESKNNYRNARALGSGTYGDVFKMYRGSDVAVKVVTSDNTAEMEMTVWPQISHPNMVPLLDLLRGPQHTAIFIMPVEKTSLFDKITDKNFRVRTNSLMFIKDWLHDVLCGLEYLHLRKVCHLDIKSDNILISRDHRAMVCDFTFVNSANKPLERCHLGSPLKYRPPEACHSLPKDTKIDGVSCDMWCYSIMMIEIFTYFVSRKVSGGMFWFKEVYPTLFHALQETNFEETMAKTFPGENINMEDSNLALNFIHLFLKLDQKDRFTTVEAVRHPFLGTGSDLGPDPDPIWIHRGACESTLQNIYHDEEPPQGSDETNKIGSFLATGDNVISCRTKNSKFTQTSPYCELSDENSERSLQNYKYNSSNSSSTGFKVGSTLSKNKNNSRGILRWFRKKCSSFRKMVKCCYPTY